MKVLKGILSESEGYYLDVRRKIQKKLAGLPGGSIKEREISGQKYYYLQQRRGDKVVHQYLGKVKSTDLEKQIQMRKALKAELKKVNEALKILKRAKGKKRA